MSCKDFFWSTGITQVPNHNNWRCVVFRGRDEPCSLCQGSHEVLRVNEQKTYIIWVPCDVAHSSSSTRCETWGTETRTSSQSSCSTTISECGNLTFSSQVPNDRVTSAARCGERRLDVMVPRQRRDLVQLRASRSGSIWFARGFQIPNENLRET